MLDRIPQEILSNIARHLALSPITSVSETSLPPIPPLNLLLTCRTICEAISPLSNPRLYARLYRSYFDTSAAERRIGRKLRAQDLLKELEKRTRALLRLRRQVQAGDATQVQEGDLWALYLMLIENDGKNIEHLLTPNAVLHLPTFLDLYHQQHFLASAIEPGYPDETVGRSLAMWIAWLVGGSGPADETAEQREERMFVLRPYVFAAQHYNVYFAPWVLPDLPLAPSADGANNAESDPFVADLAPKSRLVKMEMYGQDIQLSPPILAHAAILRFFFKKPGEEWDESEGSTTVATPYEMSTGIVEGQNGGNTSTLLQSLDSHETLDELQRRLGTNDAPAVPQTPPVRYPLISNSRSHDRDFLRLRSCFDPYVSRGLKRSAWHGSWEGCWEGTFSFFDFDAFRTMLAGNVRALYDGPYGEQAQVWRIKETYVRRKGYVRKPRDETSDEDEDDADEGAADKKDVGNGKEAGEVEETKEPRDHLNSEDLERLVSEIRDEERAAKRNKPNNRSKKRKAQKKASGLPLSGPMINAGFPTTQRPSVYASMASAAAEAETLRETIQQQIDAIPGYEVVPEDDLEEMLEEEDGGEEAGLELLLSGTGHSAWGKFILKGRVRAWDGMASMVKEYSPDSRGKWIYRGYVLSGDIFVGRWRDTFTPEAYVGYEGTFILNRR